MNPKRKLNWNPFLVTKGTSFVILIQFRTQHLKIKRNCQGVNAVTSGCASFSFIRVNHIPIQHLGAYGSLAALTIICKCPNKRNLSALFFFLSLPVFSLDIFQYWRLYLLTLVLGIGGSFQFGMQVSVIASPAVVQLPSI